MILGTPLVQDARLDKCRCGGAPWISDGGAISVLCKDCNQSFHNGHASVTRIIVDWNAEQKK